MKKTIPILAAALSLIMITSSISIAVKAIQKKNLAETEIEALHAQVAELQKKHPHKSATEEHFNSKEERMALQEATPEPWAPFISEENSEKPPRETFEERMTRMKEEDPEGYAERIQQRKERQENIRYDLAKRTANFMELNTAFMTGSERENHELLIGKMANIWELTDQFADPEQAPNRESMRELSSEIREVRPLMEEERTVMFKQLASDIGYTGDNVQALAKHIEEIISTTTIKIPGGRGGRPSGGGGGR